MKSNITITLNKKEEYLNKFNDQRISPELNTYILEECKPIKTKKELQLNIQSNFEMTNQEKEEFVKMVRLNYQDDIDELKELSKKLMFIDIYMFLIGVIFLVLYSCNINIRVASEIILIIGWVLIWESIYNFIFARTENKLKMARRKQLIESEIIFK